ncbi:Acetyl-CoA synthetase-like protein [Mycena venus]|uniref:Acetyl-CoA synthetase-like protein n=1 Tax=Mycena venus TaxID=2733690 RepID=A0A8H6YXW8_9AGAR|nr:Acetyl-CoA synthetase-like protein [Mycena venus]
MAHFMSWTLEALAKHPSRPLFKEYVPTDGSPSWVSVSYKTFLQDLERSAAFWVEHLSALGVKQNEVVGLWFVVLRIPSITGVKYSDCAHIYGLARAGYVPEVLNAKMTIPIIRDLFVKTGGKALIFEPSFVNSVTDIELPTLAIPDLASLPAVSLPLPDLPEVAPDRPCTHLPYQWHNIGHTEACPRDAPVDKMPGPSAVVQDMAVLPGWPTTHRQQYWLLRQYRVCNFPILAITYLSWSGHCLVQTSKSDFELDEFLAMLNEGLNALFLYAPWFSKLLNIARSNPTVLAALQGMGQINYTGAALNPEDEVWATEQGIPVTALYATTETAITMVTPLAEKGVLPAMRLIDGLDYKFIPTKGLDQKDLDGDSQNRVQGGQLFDLFLPADADNCPHSSVRNRPDGHITGDLFEEVKPGLYCFRGRNDDWIRTGKHFAFCDTKSIEDHVLTSCADLVRNCVVVGHYKPAVVLFVEPTEPSNSPEDETLLKTAILDRISAFNARLIVHERINSAAQIVSVPSGSLPRTTEKGNIRRKAVEDEHSAVLKEIYTNFEV